MWVLAELLSRDEWGETVQAQPAPLQQENSSGASAHLHSQKRLLRSRRRCSGSFFCSYAGAQLMHMHKHKNVQAHFMLFAHMHV